MSARLNMIMPVFRDKWSNPWVVIAIENGVFGAAHDQTIEIYNLFAADFAPAVAEICEGEVQLALIKCKFRLDPNCKIGCQGHDPIQDAWVVRLFDSSREVTREEWAIVKVVVQNLPFEIA